GVDNSPVRIFLAGGRLLLRRPTHTPGVGIDSGESSPLRVLKESCRMLRLFVGCAALTLAVTACSAGGKKPAAGLEEFIQDSNDAFENARTEAAKKRIVKELAVKLVKFAEKHAKEPEAIQALIVTVSLPVEPGKDSPRAKALAILKKDYAANEDLGEHVQQ